MVSVAVVSMVPVVVEVVTSQAGISASLAVPLVPVPLLAPAEVVELSSVRWEADSVVRANLAVVVLLLALALALAPAAPGRGRVVPFLVGVGNRDALRAPLPPAAADDAAGRLGASLGRMGRSRTHTWMLALREEVEEEAVALSAPPSCPPRRGLSGVPNIGADAGADAVAVVIALK